MQTHTITLSEDPDLLNALSEIVQLPDPSLESLATPLKTKKRGMAIVIEMKDRRSS